MATRKNGNADGESRHPVGVELLCNECTQTIIVECYVSCSEAIRVLFLASDGGGTLKGLYFRPSSSSTVGRGLSGYKSIASLETT